MRPLNAEQARGAKLFRRNRSAWHNPQVVWRFPHDKIRPDIEKAFRNCDVLHKSNLFPGKFHLTVLMVDINLSASVDSMDS
jgi:hypothetical protein